MADGTEQPQAHEPVLVSACLLGMRTRYDGGSKPDAEVIALKDTSRVIPVCPEVLGGLPTPRVPAEIESGDGHDVLDGNSRVVRRDGADVTTEYLAGAEKVVSEAKRHGVCVAYMKDKSPACGGLHIERRGETVRGQGVCAAALARMGIRIITR